MTPTSASAESLVFILYIVYIYCLERYAVRFLCVCALMNVGVCVRALVSVRAQHSAQDTHTNIYEGANTQEHSHFQTY
jgi:hypothetical protein